MRIPKRKPSRYYDVNPDPYLTKETILKLKAELDRMLNKTRPKLIEEMQLAASNGDFSENHAYQMAKGRLRGLNHRILIIEEQLNQAIPIEENKRDGIIRIGSTVTLEINGKQRTYQILGSQETNPTSGKISHISPLGLALLKHTAGEIISVQTEQRAVEYKIIKVE